MGVALTELGLVPWEVTVGEVGVARELDVMITTHTGSVHAEKRPPEVELLDAAGLLDARQVHVHCNACTERELDLLAGAGASVSVTPETELQMGMGYPVTSKLIERGMTPSLGADVISNNRGDLFGQMRLGLGCERARVNQLKLDHLEMPELIAAHGRPDARTSRLSAAPRPWAWTRRSARSSRARRPIWCSCAAPAPR